MYTRILVAIDQSNYHTFVFQTALTLARKTTARLLLVNVLCLDDIGYSDIYRDRSLTIPASIHSALQQHALAWEQCRSKSLETLRSLYTAATAAGLSADLSQPFGEPGRTICEQAASWGADLIVIGRRGLDGLTEERVGSVSSYVTHHAPCSVMTVQHGRRQNNGISSRSSRARSLSTTGSGL